jgi:hypothetical protein
MQSDLLTAVSPFHMMHELKSGQLEVLQVDLPDSEREIGFVLLKNARPSALSHLLMQAIRNKTALVAS